MFKKVVWIFSNLYGRLLGRVFLAPFHRAMITLSLHGLGYGNMYRDKWTGEEWFIRNILVKQKPRVIFDIGANVGDYSKLLIEHTEATVHAFEPNPTAFKKLLVLPNRIIKNNCAVGAEKTTGTLYFQSDFDRRASLDSRVREGNEEKVDVTSIATYVRENKITSIDLIKIDTEGYEKEVFKGLGEVRPKFIQFEFDINHLLTGCTVYELSQMIPEYTFYRLLPNGWLKIDTKRYVNNVFMFSNVIAVRND